MWCCAWWFPLPGTAQGSLEYGAVSAVAGATCKRRWLRWTVWQQEPRKQYQTVWESEHWCMNSSSHRKPPRNVTSNCTLEWSFYHSHPEGIIILFHTCRCCQADGLCGETIIQKYFFFTFIFIGCNKKWKNKTVLFIDLYFVLIVVSAAKFMLKLENKTTASTRQTAHCIK